MNWFNIIAGIASIASFIVSVFVAGNVYSIKVKISQKARGENIIQAGGNINV
jgi:hypothetical protein